MKLKDLHNEAMRCLKNNYLSLFGIVILEAILSSVLAGLANRSETPVLRLILTIVVYAITVPLSYGVVASFIKVSRSEKVSTFDFISDGMKAFKKVWAVFGRTILKLLLPAILLIITVFVSSLFSIMVSFSSTLNDSPTVALVSIVFSILAIVSSVFYIVKALLYSLTSYILYDNPEFTGKEVVEESARMMKGNRGKYFLLTLYLAALIVIITLIGVAIPMLIQSLVAKIVSTLISAVLCIAGIFALLPYAYAIQVAFYNLLKESIDGNSDSVKTTEE